MVTVKKAKILKLEFWADSFHEGEWACKGLKRNLSVIKKEYIDGFIPRYVFELNESTHLEITIFGSYQNWSPLPERIAGLLSWGKPDLVVYDPITQEIILAIEETAAVPTGNQALQRCERIYGSARMGVPFWYLLSEFGTHVDGGVRRDSIWPTIVALKLSSIKRIPSLVLHYADIDNPENYEFGVGMAELFNTLDLMIRIWAGTEGPEKMKPILTRQYGSMLTFIKQQWVNQLDFLPGLDEINDDMAEAIASHVLDSGSDSKLKFTDFLSWGISSTLPPSIRASLMVGGVIKKDPLVARLEKNVSSGKAYNLSRNAGSRPQPVEKVRLWIKQQKTLFTHGNKTNAIFSMNLRKFPTSASGLHLTTAKNVIYLCDEWLDVYEAIAKAYPRLVALQNRFNSNMPVMIYISNSLRPGRIFGDPFTGQLSAFATIFSKNLLGEKERVVLAYYPHQVHTQLFSSSGQMRMNKGIATMKELVDIGIFHGGVAIDFANQSIL